MPLSRFLAPFVAVGLLAIAADASAGTLTLRDEAQVLSPGDMDQLRAVVARAPFDARLATTNAYADQAGLSRFVGALVSEPDMVAVGIDPQHHHVQVHFGTRTHIPESEWPAIERAGNDAFKRGAWEEGGAAIFKAASAAVTTTGGATAPVTSAGQGHTSLLGPGLVVLLIGGVVLAFVLYGVFARRRGPQVGQPGYDGYGGGGPYPAGGPYPGGASGPYYGPGGAPGGGMGALGGGLIGAGLGGLAGYELGKMEGERERGRERDEGFVGGGSAHDDDRGNYDAGGGGSSWDDPGTGGGGSDFGGGGGDSGGGGGGDSGGGGSDF